MKFQNLFKITKAIKKSKETEAKFSHYFKHIPNFIRLYWRLFRDSRVPAKLKLMLIGSIIYFISPIDFFPEFLIPFVGYVDDGLILVLAFRYFILWSPKEVVKEKIIEIDSEMLEKQAKKDPD